jgi:hypothetical protein
MNTNEISSRNMMKLVLEKKALENAKENLKRKKGGTYNGTYWKLFNIIYQWDMQMLSKTTKFGPQLATVSDNTHFLLEIQGELNIETNLNTKRHLSRSTTDGISSHVFF